MLSPQLVCFVKMFTMPVFCIWWNRRNADLRFVLNNWQFDKYMSLAHFYRPALVIVADAGVL